MFTLIKSIERIGFVWSQECLTLITSDNTSSLTNGDGGSGKIEATSSSKISSGTLDEEPYVVLIEEAWFSFDWEFTRNEEPLLVLIEETCCSCNWECGLVSITWRISHKSEADKDTYIGVRTPNQSTLSFLRYLKYLLCSCLHGTEVVQGSS